MGNVRGTYVWPWLQCCAGRSTTQFPLLDSKAVFIGFTLAHRMQNILRFATWRQPYDADEFAVHQDVSWRLRQMCPILSFSIFSSSCFSLQILPCLHSFCDACLRRELPSQSFTLLCPVCRQQFILPPAGVINFNSNSVTHGFNLWSTLQICSLQTNPFVTEFTRLYVDGAQPAADEDPVQRDTIYCSSHAGSTSDSYFDQIHSDTE